MLTMDVIEEEKVKLMYLEELNIVLQEKRYQNQ